MDSCETGNTEISALRKRTIMDFVETGCDRDDPCETVRSTRRGQSYRCYLYDPQPTRPSDVQPKYFDIRTFDRVDGSLLLYETSAPTIRNDVLAYHDDPTWTKLHWLHLAKSHLPLLFPHGSAGRICTKFGNCRAKPVSGGSGEARVLPFFFWRFFCVFARLSILACSFLGVNHGRRSPVWH